MDDIDYPGSYRSADNLSKRSQDNFFFALRSHLLCLIGAAALSVANIPHWLPSALQFLLFLGALHCSIYLFHKRPDKLWYSSRAVAESIKTVSWRYVCRAEPFNEDDEKSLSLFQNKLRAILDQNRSVAEGLVELLSADQITQKMLMVRGASLEERRKTYSVHRIDNQLDWYAGKASFNDKKSRAFFASLVLANFAGLVFAAVRIKFPDVSYWPTDIFVAIAASLLSWMQAKRFSELSASYTLAAQDIGFLKSAMQSAQSEDDFSSFVGDAENAFSREHTLWIARKDV